MVEKSIDYLARNIESTFLGMKLMFGDNMTLTEKIVVSMTLFSGFLLNVLYYPKGTLLGFIVGLFLVTTFVHGIPFAYRELRIRRIQKAYRHNVVFLDDEIRDMTSIKPNTAELDTHIPRHLATNEESYVNYREALNVLKERLTPYIGGGVRSEISVKEDLERFRSVINTASFKMNDVFSCTDYQVNPNTETWLNEHVPEVIRSATSKLDFLKETLDVLMKERMAIKSGVEGEESVREYLKDFEDMLLPLYGTRFQAEKGTVENDALLFTETGIYSLEIKNIGASGDKTIRITKDGLWYEKFKSSDWKRSERDAIFDQVNRHTALTETLIREKFGRESKYMVKSIIIIPNKNLKIENESSFHIIRPSQIVSLIREMDVVLTHDECVAVSDFVKSKDIGQARYEHLDALAYVKKIVETYESLQRDCEFLKRTFIIQETYVERVTQNNLHELLRLKYLNCDNARSVI